METICLSDKEKKELVGKLSLSSTAGGWVFIVMGLFPFALLALAALGIIPTAFEWTGEEIGVFIAWGAVFLLPGVWLLRQKKKVAALLNKPMRMQTAVIAGFDSIPYFGWRMRLQIGEQTGHMRIVAKPQWAVGEKMKLYLTEDGRFFPQNITQTVDLGSIDTAQRERRWRWGWGCATAVVVSLLLIGMLFAIYD